MSGATRDLAVDCSRIDSKRLLEDWDWLLPQDHTALMIGAMGDWIFGAPDGSIWLLELIEGTYLKIANTSQEFNEEKKSVEKLDDWFGAIWVSRAHENGMVPALDECLGWTNHPQLGGTFEVSNLSVFKLSVYQTIMGQLFRQMHTGR